MRILKLINSKWAALSWYTRLAFKAGGVGVTVFLAGFVLPISVPLPSANSPNVDGDVNSKAVASLTNEELEHFQALSRWGSSIQERSVASGVAQNSVEKQALTYQGLIVSAERVVLLLLPGGSLQRFKEGDLLPDGRQIQSITDNSVAIIDNGDVQTLNLFPLIKAADDQPAQGN